ncbi:DMT family transporter [Actibacterium pelagium]|uniref:Membrane protein n=1 Tax=Actibacterium pelagium TaxID=2029103 RepID=A0A917AH69_9RHOB|nr:DMT family transporter [Actibacterium pelagium]GGE52646.1 membrane protein [Actibacterium pelagium]
MQNISPLSGNKAGVFYGLAAFGIYATHDLFIKQLGGTYSPFQILFFSALLSFPFITFFMIHDARPGTLRPTHPWWLALRSLSGAFTAICAFYAFATLPLSQVYALVFATPLLITVLAIPMLGETVGPRRLLAVLVGLGGVVVVVQPNPASLEWGHAAGLAAAVSGALNSVISRKIGNEERVVVMVLYPMITNLIVAALFLPFVYIEVALVDLGFMAIVSILGLIGMGFLVTGYVKSNAVLVAPTQYSQIIWAVLFGALFFDEYPGTETYIGATIIILSGIYILRREASGKVRTKSPVLESRTRIGLSSPLRVGLILRRRARKSEKG